MVKLRLETDLATSLKATADLNKAVDKIAKSFSATVKEANALEKAAARIVQQNLTPQEQYNKKLEAMAKAVKAGKMSMDDAERTAGRLRTTLQGTFGAGAGADVVSFFGRFVGPGALVGLATLGLQNFKAEVEKVRLAAKTSFTGMGQLAQLALDQPDPFKARDEMFAEARKLGVTTGATSQNEQGNFLFSLLSAKFNPADREHFAKLTGSGAIADVEPFVAAVNAIRKSAPELSPRQVLAMGLIAGGPSPGKASGLVAASGEAGSAIKQLGLTQGFNLAATGILSEIYGQSEAGTRVVQFTKQFEKEGLQAFPELKGLAGPDLVEAIGKTGLDQPNLSKYVGDRAEAMQFVRDLYGNLPQLRELTARTEAAKPELTDLLLTLATGDAEQAGGLGARVSTARRDRSLATRATSQNVLEAIHNDIVSARRQRGGVLAGVANAIGPAGSIDQYLSGFSTQGGIEETIKNLSQSHQADLSAETSSAVVKLLESIDSKLTPLEPPKPAGRQE